MSQGEPGKLVLRFQNPDRKRELVEAAAREGVPVVHFVYECYLHWKHKRELDEQADQLVPELARQVGW